jgi:hypothetical protein
VAPAQFDGSSVEELPGCSRAAGPRDLPPVAESASSIRIADPCRRCPHKVPRPPCVAVEHRRSASPLTSRSRWPLRAGHSELAASLREATPDQLSILFPCLIPKLVCDRRFEGVDPAVRRQRVCVRMRGSSSNTRRALVSHFVSRSSRGGWKHLASADRACYACMASLFRRATALVAVGSWQSELGRHHGVTEWAAHRAAQRRRGAARAPWWEPRRSVAVGRAQRPGRHV